MKAPFDLVEISPGRRLHALIEGPTGAPLVVFDHGAFGIYADGWWVKEKLKRDNRVLLYGRAGMGWSDPAPPGAELTAEFHVEDLRRLLTVVGAHPPFMLVGHSMAGFRLQAFAALYPDELAGLVFVDAMNPAALRLPGGMKVLTRFSALLAAGHRAAGFGAMRLAAPFARDQMALQAQRQQEKRFIFGDSAHWKAAKREVDATDPMARYFNTLASLSCPVAVFSRNAQGGACAPIAKVAATHGLYGKVIGLAGETHTSLLNPKHAEMIAGQVRLMRQTHLTAV